MRLSFILSFVIIFCHCSSKKINKNELILETFQLGEQFNVRSLDTNKTFKKTKYLDNYYELSENRYCIVKPIVDQNNILYRLHLFFGNDKSSYYERITEDDTTYYLDFYREKYGNENKYKYVHEWDSIIQRDLDIVIFGGFNTRQRKSIDTNYLNINPYSVYVWNTTDMNIELWFRHDNLNFDHKEIYWGGVKYSLSRNKRDEIEKNKDEKQKKKDLERL